MFLRSMLWGKAGFLPNPRNRGTSEIRAQFGKNGFKREFMEICWPILKQNFEFQVQLRRKKKYRRKKIFTPIFFFWKALGYISIDRACLGKTPLPVNMPSNSSEFVVWMGIISFGFILSISSLSSIFEAWPETCLRTNVFCPFSLWQQHPLIFPSYRSESTNRYFANFCLCLMYSIHGNFKEKLLLALIWAPTTTTSCHIIGSLSKRRRQHCAPIIVCFFQQKKKNWCSWKKYIFCSFNPYPRKSSNDIGLFIIIEWIVGRP